MPGLKLVREQPALEGLLPCPFCSSERLRIDTLYFDDDGEHDGVECLDCDAMNRVEMWNRRVGSANWRLTFAHQSGISIWTDDPQRIDIIAPGQMNIREAIAWAKLRVPGSWMLVQAYRDE